MTDTLVPQTPPTAPEPTGQTTPPVPDEEKEQLNKKLVELEAQKEHWRNKYERDIVNVPNPDPVPSSEEAFSDEGKLLEGKIKELNSKIDELKTESTKKDLQSAYPEFKEKWSELETFRELPENKGMNLRTAARAYLIENGLLDVPRKGLEKTTGGPRVPISSEMTNDDVKALRETDYKKYKQLLTEGKIKIGS